MWPRPLLLRPGSALRVSACRFTLLRLGPSSLQTRRDGGNRQNVQTASAERGGGEREREREGAREGGRKMQSLISLSPQHHHHHHHHPRIDMNSLSVTPHAVNLESDLNRRARACVCTCECPVATPLPQLCPDCCSPEEDPAGVRRLQTSTKLPWQEASSERGGGHR